MRAVTYDSYGEPSRLRLTQQPTPKCAPGEVLIRVRCAAVNPVDWKIMAGYLDRILYVQFPAIPGWDVAGVVESVGLDTPEFRAGDEVLAYARKDFVHGGTFAEFVSVPVRAVARKPSALSWEQAAGLPLAGLTARQLLDRIGLHSGGSQTVLVHAAAGGVGALAVQLARNAGARVIGTASARNHDFLRSLGCEPVAYGPGLLERVRALAPEGVDLVADCVGGVLDVTRAVLKEGGRHGSVVDASVAEAGGQYVWGRPDGAELERLAQVAAEGRLTVAIERAFPLREAAKALDLNRSGHVRGKVVLRVSP